MMKTLVWGFCGSSGRAIVDALREELDITGWVSDQAGSTDIWRFIRADIPQIRSSPAAAGLFADVYRQSFPVYQVMAARRGDYYADLHRVTNEFALNYYYFHEWLTSRQIELVIFAALPHEGSDYVLYQVARQLGIKTLMCYQSIFASRFFLTTALTDFGHFRTVPADPAAVPVQIERSYHQALFYMQDVEKRQAAEAGMTAVGAVTETLRAVAGRGRAFGRLMAGAGLFNVSQLARQWLESKREAAYEAALAAAVTDRQSLRRLLSGSAKIAYFPLHLQPELTTSAIGGIFQDQLYALECLRKLLGDEWIIIVKDNPKQTAFQRDDLFFRRLAAVPGIYLADRLFPSVEIIARATLTATITGTAGWEAVKGGGKCLVFGQAWYAGLGNCLVYDGSQTQESVREFLDKPVPFPHIQASFDALMAKTGCGVVDPAYNVMAECYHDQQNARKVVQSLARVIRHPDTLWHDAC